MSFILDALRKSENERQRGAVPGIGDVPAVVHSTRIPKWAIALIAVLSVGVIVLALAWWRSASGPAAEMPVARPAGVIPRPAPQPPVDDDVRNLARESATVAEPAPVAVSTPPASERRAAPAPAAAPAPLADPGAIAAAPNMMELVASGISLPDLTLEFHVYSTNAAERRVRINSAGYQEGDSLNEGPRIIAITIEGVVLSHNGRLFLLTPD